MLAFENYRHEMAAPAENLISCISVGTTAACRNLAYEFPEHWEHCLIEVFWLSSGATEMAFGLSLGAAPVIYAPLQSGVPRQFKVNKRKFLWLIATGGTDIVRISVVSDFKLPVDPFGFQATMGYRPSIFLHADQFSAANGAAPAPQEVGIQHNATQTIPPLMANGWAQGLRTLDFSGNKALRIDALAPSFPLVEGPFTYIMAFSMPTIFGYHGLIDFRNSALPATRYFQHYLRNTGQPEAFCQGAAAGGTRLAGGSVPAAVPVILGITRRSGSQDICLLSNALGAQDLDVAGPFAGSGAIAADRVTIGADFDGVTYGSFANYQLRALAIWFGTDIPIATMRAALPRFAVNTNCPLA